MSDKPIVHIGENSPEEVAYKLLKVIANLERKSLVNSAPEGREWAAADREYVLSTYAECFEAVRGLRPSHN